MSIKKMNQLRKAFRALDVDEKRGILTAYNERFLFIPIKLIHSIEDRLRENFGPVAATSLQYEIGREGGAEYARIAQKAGFGIKRPESIREIAEQLGTLSGWGKVEVVDFDFENSRARIRWRNGVSVRNRKGKTP